MNGRVERYPRAAIHHFVSLRRSRHNARSAARKILSAAASVRQEPDWEGVARELYEAVIEGVSIANSEPGLIRIQNAMTAFERAAGEDEG